MHRLNDKDLAQLISWWQDHRKQNHGVQIVNENEGLSITVTIGDRQYTAMHRDFMGAIKQVDAAIKRTPRFGR